MRSDDRRKGGSDERNEREVRKVMRDEIIGVL